jgi:putative transposase
MSRSYSSVHIHLVFSTKERRPLLSDPGIRAEMHRYLGGVSKTLDCQPLIVGGVADHVHLLASLGKSRSQAEWVRELKKVSSAWIKMRDPRLAEFAWQGGYGAFSVDKTSIDRVRDYIARQEEHHRVRTFQDEFRELLREHDIEWDEEYIWL